MDAKPILAAVARALREQAFEAILIGNAAAALQGAPVTTVDLDFLIRKTPTNLRKLKAVAKSMDAVVFTPHYPVSGLFRLIRDDDGLQVDFMTRINGIRSFNSLRAHASEIGVEQEKILVAALTDIIASKRAADRPRGTAQSSISSKKPSAKQNQLDALKVESDRDLIDQIRRNLAKPPGQRTNFLRKRIALRGSAF